MISFIFLFQVRSLFLISKNNDTEAGWAVFATALASSVCIGIYVLSLLPAGDQRSSEYETLRTETEPLLGAQNHSVYGRFSYGEATDPHYLGVAKEGTPFLNR